MERFIFPCLRSLIQIICWSAEHPCMIFEHGLEQWRLNAWQDCIWVIYEILSVITIIRISDMSAFISVEAFYWNFTNVDCWYHWVRSQCMMSFFFFFFAKQFLVQHIFLPFNLHLIVSWDFLFQPCQHVKNLHLCKIPDIY